MAPPHWPHPGYLDVGQNPKTINLGVCSAAPKGWWGLQRNLPFGATVEGGGVHNGPATERLAAL
jgi:hypothetical protein